MDPRTRAMVDRAAALCGVSAVLLDLGTGAEDSQGGARRDGDGGWGRDAGPAVSRPAVRRCRVGRPSGVVVVAARRPVRIGHGGKSRVQEDNAA